MKDWLGSESIMLGNHGHIVRKRAEGLNTPELFEIFSGLNQTDVQSTDSVQLSGSGITAPSDPNPCPNHGSAVVFGVLSMVGIAALGQRPQKRSLNASCFRNARVSKSFPHLVLWSART